MGEKVILLSSNELDNNDRNLIKLIEFYGASCSTITLNDINRSINYLREHINSNCLCLMVNTKFLLDIFPDKEFFNTFKSFLFSRTSSVLIYNLYPDNRLNSAIEHLSDNAIRSIGNHELSHNTIQVEDGFRNICKQFSGLSFEYTNNDIDFSLNLGTRAKDIQSLICINNSPFFVKIKRKNCNLFILANKKLLDIDDTVDEQWNFKEYFSQFIPLLMFIKYTFGTSCWNSNKTYASLIIDDPLLRPRYGFLNYKRLLNLMDINNFFTTIAFIPLNYRRTKKRIANILNERNDKFKICIHGCNHTNNEFGINNLDRLNRLTKQATKKMNIHKKSTRLAFDNIMIFPQGRFSSQAIRILKSNGYLAAVNTTPFSIDDFYELRLSDLLEMAVMRYHCFPIFKRRHPKEVIDFAFDLFLGKPAFIVEHHECFKNGCERILELIRSINSLDKNIKWRGLGYIIENSYMEKSSDKRTKQIKIYSNKSLIENPSNFRKKFLITKNECGEIPINNVTVNGTAVSHELDDHFLTISIEIPSQTTIELEINYEDRYPYVEGKESIKEQVAIWIRRYLSEFRDNYISKNELLLSIVKRVIQIKRTI